MRRPIKYQLIRLSIAAAGDYPINAEADKTYGKITGIQFTTTDEAALKDAVFKKFDIDSNDIFPEGFEVKLIKSGEDLKPNERWEDLDERADGSTIAGMFTDAGNAAAYPYNARIYLRLANPTE
jgi:hypothetical protein